MVVCLIASLQGSLVIPFPWRIWKPGVAQSTSPCRAQQCGEVPCWFKGGSVCHCSVLSLRDRKASPKLCPSTASKNSPSPNALSPPADLNLCAAFPEASQSLHCCAQVLWDPAAGKAQISWTSHTLRDAVLSICLGLARICLLPELRFISANLCA